MISITTISRKHKLIDNKAEQWFPGMVREWAEESEGSQKTLGNFKGDGYVHNLGVMVPQCFHL